MSEYLTKRQRNLNIGIPIYTENDSVLDVIGNGNVSGIVTAAQFRKRFPVGDYGKVGITTIYDAFGIPINTYNNTFDCLIEPSGDIHKLDLGPL